MMETRTDEIADGVYRLSTLVPDIGPTGFTFNQFLIADDEALLFHTGPRAMFPLVSEAVARVVPLEQLRYIAFGHLEADECGSMNQFLAAAPNAQVAHGAMGCLVSLNDLCDRPPLPLEDGQALELGRHVVVHRDTPHVPHGWDARVLYERTTNTLLAGDLFTHLGDGPALTTDDILGPAEEAEDIFSATALTPATASTIHRLAEFAPTTLAVMHGSSFEGDGAAALHGLADLYADRVANAADGG
jgi:flavorubredoxin